MCEWCGYTRGLFECAHGGDVDGFGCFSAYHTRHTTTKPQPQPQPQRHTTNQTTTPTNHPTHTQQQHIKTHNNITSVFSVLSLLVCLFCHSFLFFVSSLFVLSVLCFLFLLFFCFFNLVSFFGSPLFPMMCFFEFLFVLLVSPWFPNDKNVTFVPFSSLLLFLLSYRAIFSKPRLLQLRLFVICCVCPLKGVLTFRALVVFSFLARLSFVNIVCCDTLKQISAEIQCHRGDRPSWGPLEPMFLSK